MLFILANARVYYERSRAGEPLLFITGFTISAAVFEPILRLYEQKFECITYDNRGSGRSDAPPTPNLDARAGRRRAPPARRAWVSTARTCTASRWAA